MSETIALVPARCGSKGVPNKNIRLLGGQPLIAWSIKAALKSKQINRVLVSTDSQEYADLAISLGAEVPFLRPAEISGDNSIDFDFIDHALNWFSTNGGEPQYIVHLRPTTPLREPALIDEAIKIFRNHPHATALRSVHEMPESAYKAFEIAPEGLLKRLGCDKTDLDDANIARQQFSTTYVANGYVDVLATSFIRTHNLIHGSWVLPFITPQVVEVDVQEDFEYLEYQITQKPLIAQKLFK